jgi:thioredoxin 1
MTKTLTHVTDSTFDAEVVRSATPVLVDFYADWCGPCNMIAPVLERLAGEYAGKVKIVKVNVDEEGDLANRFGISGIPTMIFFKDGKAVDHVVGALPPQALKEKIEAVVPVATPQKR